MQSTIPVAHDFNCPWCWIGLFQARRLQREFGVEIEWRGYELYPEDLPWPEAPGVPPPTLIEPPNGPGRLALAYAAAGMDPPVCPRPRQMRTHAAHEAVEYARTEGTHDALVERFYRGHWEQGLDLRDPAVLAHLAQGTVRDVGRMLDSVRDRRNAKQIVPFDADAYARGVFYVPTFWIGAHRLAEQPYTALRGAMLEAGHVETSGHEPYAALSFPPSGGDRPWVVVNMVATIDGKTVMGTRNDPVGDLGSAADHAAMRRIEDACDAVMIGAGTLRATPKLHFDPRLQRIVVTRSGALDFEGRFFTDAPERAVVATPEGRVLGPPDGVSVWQGGTEGVDLAALLGWLRAARGIRTLVVEGGSDLNAALIGADLADELFLTLAPKVKLGADTPTYAGGVALAREALQAYTIVEQARVGDELFIRYRRDRSAR